MSFQLFSSGGACARQGSLPLLARRENDTYQFLRFEDGGEGGGGKSMLKNKWVRMDSSLDVIIRGVNWGEEEDESHTERWNIAGRGKWIRCRLHEDQRKAWHTHYPWQPSSFNWKESRDLCRVFNDPQFPWQSHGSAFERRASNESNNLCRGGKKGRNALVWLFFIYLLEL